MRSVFFPAILIAAVLVSAEKSMILDDFTSNNGQNRLGQSWYYYSDENDGGNSEILHTTRKAGGGFSDIVYDTVDDSTNLCGKIEFIFGDRKTVSFNDPFVGIGTDIAPPGDSVDLTGMRSVRFRVRSSPPLNFVFEIESNNVLDNAYYYQVFTASEEWNEYIVDISDYYQPCWTSDEVDLAEAISCVRKFNWKMYYSNNRDLNAAGSLMIDIVIIEGIDAIPRKVPIVPCNKELVIQPSHAQQVFTMYDLLGRELAGGIARHPAISGMVIRKTADGARVHAVP